MGDQDVPSPIDFHDPAQVRADVADGILSPEAARRDYGLVGD